MKLTPTAIVMATMLEAKPFVPGMSLKQTCNAPFRIFQNGTTQLIISGIGKANGAMATAYLCQKFKPEFIFNFGAAGAADFSHSLGDIYHIKKIVELDRPELRSQKPCIHIPDILSGFPTAILGTRDKAVIDPGERKAVSENASLVDMEGAAIAQACRLFQIKCYLFKFVSDTPAHLEDNDIVTNIRLYRQSFYEFCSELIKKRNQLPETRNLKTKPV